jgi:hypothetical protein
MACLLAEMATLELLITEDLAIYDIVKIFWLHDQIFVPRMSVASKHQCRPDTITEHIEDIMPRGDSPERHRIADDVEPVLGTTAGNIDAILN